MKVIAISGWKRSGKDTIANYLVDIHNYRRVAFADILKDMAAIEYNIPRLYCELPEFKEAPLEQYPVMPKDEFSLNIAKMLHKEFRTLDGYAPIDYHVDASGAFLGVLGRDAQQLYWTPRALCILKGSANRSVDSNYWIDKTLDSIFEARQQGQNVVISDLRYRSEVEQLKSTLGKSVVIVRINRFENTISEDASERDLDNYKFDVVIDNTGSIEELIKQVNKLI